MIRKIIIEACVCFFLCLVSCGTQEKIVYNPPSPEEDLIARHISDGDIQSLMNDYNLYPDFREPIWDCLANDVPYDLFSYSKLTDLEKQCTNENLKELFESEVIRREENVLSELSNVSLESVSAYYQSHQDEHVFIRPVLCEAFLPVLDSLQYVDIRYLYKTFQPTDIGDSIAPYYLELRNIMLPEIKKGVSEYVSFENELKDFYMEKIFEELASYQESVLEKIVDGLLEKDLPSSRNDVDKTFESIVSKHLSSSFVNDLITKNLKELSDCINQGRQDYIEEISDHPVTDNWSITSGYFSADSINTEISLRELYSISEIQNKHDFLGWILTAASFIPGGWGLVASAADIVHGYFNAKDTGNQTATHLKSFITDFSRQLNSEVNRMVNSGEKSYNSKHKKSVENFKKAIYENY